MLPFAGAAPLARPRPATRAAAETAPSALASLQASTESVLRTMIATRVRRACVTPPACSAPEEQPAPCACWLTAEPMPTAARDLIARSGFSRSLLVRSSGSAACTMMTSAQSTLSAGTPKTSCASRMATVGFAQPCRPSPFSWAEATEMWCHLRSLEHAAARLEIHPGAPVRDLQQHVVAGRDREQSGCLAGIERDLAGADRKWSALRHGIARIDDEVHDHLIELPGIDHDTPVMGRQLGAQLNVFAQRARQHLVRCAHPFVDPQHLGFDQLPPRKRQELARELGGTLRGFQDPS